MMFMCKHHTPPSAADVTTCVLRVSLTTLPAADILYRYCPALLDTGWQHVCQECPWWHCLQQTAIQVLSGFVGHSVTACVLRHCLQQTLLYRHCPALLLDTVWQPSLPSIAIESDRRAASNVGYFTNTYQSTARCFGSNFFSLLLLFFFCIAFFLDGVWGGGIDHLALTYSPVKKGVCGTH